MRLKNAVVSYYLSSHLAIKSRYHMVCEIAFRYLSCKLLIGTYRRDINRVVYRKDPVPGPGPIHCNAKSQTIKKERER